MVAVCHDCGAMGGVVEWCMEVDIAIGEVDPNLAVDWVCADMPSSLVG
jgi:hypothetical protein